MQSVIHLLTESCLWKVWPRHSTGAARSDEQVSCPFASFQACTWLRWKAQAYELPESVWHRAHLFSPVQVFNWLDSSKSYVPVKVSSLLTFNCPEVLMMWWMWKWFLKSQCKYKITFSHFFSTWGECKNKESHQFYKVPHEIALFSHLLQASRTCSSSRLSICELSIEVTFLCSTTRPGDTSTICCARGKSVHFFKQCETNAQLG